MGEMMKNVSAEFGKKAGKALGNALFGKYGEDKRIGIRYTDGTTSRRRGRPSKQEIVASNEVARINAEQKLLETRIEAENDRLEEEREAKREAAASAKLSRKALALTSIEFDEYDPKQIVAQMNKIATIAELALKNTDGEDDHIGEAAVSLYRTGLAFLRAARPDHPMIPHFEQQLKLWAKLDKKKKRAKVKEGIGIAIPFLISAAVWYGIFLMVRSCW